MSRGAPKAPDARSGHPVPPPVAGRPTSPQVGGVAARPRPAPRPLRIRRLTMFGPAFVAAIAYVDPGNYATNFAAGSGYGGSLLWVLIGSNVIAALVQMLSAKLGLATGRNLAELCRDRFSRPAAVMLWFLAELVAIATDLAEVVGGAIAFHLLFGLPLLMGGVVTAALSFLLLGLEERGHRKFEAGIAVFLGLIVAAFLWGGSMADAFAVDVTPSLPGQQALLLTVGIVGATVMPHVIYLHSDLTRRHLSPEAEPSTASPHRPADPWYSRRLLWQIRLDVLIALGVAGFVNAAMLMMAARVFHGRSTQVESLERVYTGLQDSVGGKVALAFAVALLASGLAASSVGTYAGQVVMAGFLRRSLPIALRRLCTMAPAIVLLALNVNPTDALVWSQIALSFGIPFALIPLVRFTGDRTLMGPFVNGKATMAGATAAAAVIILLNAVLFVQAVAG
ncbi:Nramp family divalent metal transporter [Streptomyces platensis]|uniref:Nramp family divalent metal transporter n=1 Tax=Streptomyces platensis TaxID=58346 RepID=UPI00386363EE